jgi:hypothetical protein
VDKVKNSTELFLHRHSSKIRTNKNTKKNMSKSSKKRKKKQRLIYEYFICILALIGTVLAVIDIFKGLSVWQNYLDFGILTILAELSCPVLSG